jgi:hypothetical protein
MTWLTVIEYLCPNCPRICSTCRKHFPGLSSFTTYYRVCNYINTTVATIGAGTADPSGAHDLTLGFWWGSCYSIFSFICMFCRSVFVLLSFFLSLCCLFFCPLVSSNSSYKYEICAIQLVLSQFCCTHLCI